MYRLVLVGEQSISQSTFIPDTYGSIKIIQYNTGYDKDRVVFYCLADVKLVVTIRLEIFPFVLAIHFFYAFIVL